MTQVDSQSLPKIVKQEIDRIQITDIHTHIYAKDGDEIVITLNVNDQQGVGVSDNHVVAIFNGITLLEGSVVTAQTAVGNDYVWVVNVNDCRSGSFNVQLYGEDELGHRSVSSSFDIILDNIVPDVPTINPAPQSSVTGNWINYNPTINWLEPVFVSGSPVAGYVIVATTPSAGVPSPGETAVLAGTNTYVVTMTPNSLFWYASIRAVDAVGNFGPADSRPILGRSS